MSNKTQLLALAERVETLTGPCRETDQDIYMLADIENGSFKTVYTSSVDASLQLIPEGYDWVLGHTNGGLTIHAEVGGQGDEYMTFGATPALAIAAAALRARASMQE